MESGEARDFVAIATAYARAAVRDKGQRHHGKWVRLAAQRFLDDLKQAKRKDSPFTFDPWHANDACDFLEKLPHVEGEWDKPTIELHPAHVFFVVSLFGFRQPDGRRRFTHALFCIARKNAKSTLAAGILLYVLTCEDEPGPQVISAATTGDQARIIWKIAKRMVEMTPDLREAFSLQPMANSIVCGLDGFFKPINAKASTQDGLNPSAVGLDELHAHKDHDLINVLQSAAGARRNPLWLITTTEGYESPGPWPEERHFARQVLEGVVPADHYLALIWALDDEQGKEGEPDYRPADDEFDESTWVKANPLMTVNPYLLEAIRKDAIKARTESGALAEFKIKRCNRQSATATGWLNLTKWKACAGPVRLDELRGLPCWGGLDLASTTDIASLRLVWLLDGLLLTHGWRWVPEFTVDERAKRGMVPYRSWTESGLIEATPGNVIDYDVIEARVEEVNETFNLQMLAYDRWNATNTVNNLVAAGVPMIEFVQGPKSFHPAMQALERYYLSGKVAHAGDPVLQWCGANMVPRYDANLNQAPDRKRSADKIDDFVALLMATGIATNGETEFRSVYEDRGVLEIELTEV